MKRLLIVIATSLVAVGLLAASSTGEQQAKRQARSVHLIWRGVEPEAREIAGTVTVTESQTNSYFMVLGFSGGYFGIQDVAGHHIGIFSVWDPVEYDDEWKARPENVASNLQAKVLYSNPNVSVSRFGGEGTGAKTMFGCNWEIGKPVNFRVTAEADGPDRVAYTGYIGDGTNEIKLATISRLNEGKKPALTDVYSFIEDFWRNGKSKDLVRRAEFTGLSFRGPEPDAPLRPVRHVAFSADSNTLTTIDAGPLTGGGAFLQTGGETVNRTVPLWHTFRIRPASVPPRF